MNPEAFVSDRAGRVLKTQTGYWAFFPYPLPPEIIYTPALAKLLSDADGLLGELSGVSRLVPNPNLIIAPYIRREAVASSRIEGTQADMNDLLMDELLPNRRPASSDVQEIQNYLEALNFGLNNLAHMPLAGRLIREMHGILLRGVRGQFFTPGEFRRSQNWIGGSSPSDAVFVPPPVDEMLEGFSNLEKFIHANDQLPDLIKCALIHEHFETLHPFQDGNGRIGRLLITLYLIERKRLSKPVLYLSSYIESHKIDYYNSLQHVRTHGDWMPWLIYFLTAVADTSRTAIAQSAQIVELRESLRVGLTRSPRAAILLDHLFINPYISIAKARDLLGVTTPTASKTITILESEKILGKITDGSYGQVWAARPILRIVHG